VLAIAITLLALGLPLPHTTGSTTNLQMAKALADNWDSYLAFVVSFAFTAAAFALWAAIPVLIRAENGGAGRAARHGSC
jgi:uncharacterized membrane protein